MATKINSNAYNFYSKCDRDMIVVTNTMLLIAMNMLYTPDYNFIQHIFGKPKYGEYFQHILATIQH